MDSWCSRRNKPAKKEANDFGKIKSADSPYTNTLSGKFTHQSQTNKKDQDQNH